MADVKLEAVRKVYAGNVQAVKDISLYIPEGAFCVLVGPSGCGKSTLLRMVAGLETVSSGEVRIADQRVNEVEPMDRDIAMVFQNYALYPHMTVYDNMAYGLRNRRTPKAEIDSRVREAARILDLSDVLLQRRPRQLSGGQRQRVAMGRALVRKPKVFLFDEPLSNLDAKLRVQMRVEIKRLQRQLGVTSLYVTHDQLEAMTLADMLVVMNDGRIEQIGAPLDVYANPATLFVATFIGSPSMNLLPGEMAGASSVRLETGELLDVGAQAKAAGKVVVGVRPERLNPGAAGPLAMRIDLVEELGMGRLLHGKLGTAAMTVHLDTGLPVSAGETIRLAPAAQSLHLFDPASGQALPR